LDLFDALQGLIPFGLWRDYVGDLSSFLGSISRVMACARCSVVPYMVG